MYSTQQRLSKKSSEEEAGCEKLASVSLTLCCSLYGVIYYYKVQIHPDTLIAIE